MEAKAEVVVVREFDYTDGVRARMTPGMPNPHIHVQAAESLASRGYVTIVPTPEPAPVEEPEPTPEPDPIPDLAPKNAKEGPREAHSSRRTPR